MNWQFSDAEKNFLNSLNGNKCRFMIVGMVASILQGGFEATQDVDLWVENLGSDQFLKAVKEAGAFYVPPSPLSGNPPMIGGESFRVFDLVLNMSGLGDFNSEYQYTLDFDIYGVPVKVLSIERIILSKKAANRPKDKIHLLTLEQVSKVKNLKK